MADSWDNKHTCSRCQAMAHDVVQDEYDHALLECCFCGQRDRVKPLRRARKTQPASKSQAEEFRFTTGRYAGKTLAEVDADEGGRRYLEFMRRTNESLRSVIEAHLFQNT